MRIAMSVRQSICPSEPASGTYGLFNCMKTVVKEY